MCKLPRAWGNAKKQKKAFSPKQFVLPFPKAVHSPSVFFHMEKQNKNIFEVFIQNLHQSSFIHSAGN